MIPSAGSRNPRFCSGSRRFCQGQRRNSTAVALDMQGRKGMSEGGSKGRSGQRFGAAGSRRGYSLWVDLQIGPARTLGKRIMKSSPSSATQFRFRRFDRQGLALRSRRRQRMPGSGAQGSVTVREIFDVIFMSGSALRMAIRPCQTRKERNTGSRAKGRHCSCRYL